MTDSVLAGYVADSVERISGQVNNPDATADFAYNLLTTYGYVARAAQDYAADVISQAEFDRIISHAAEMYGQ